MFCIDLISLKRREAGSNTPMFFATGTDRDLLFITCTPESDSSDSIQSVFDRLAAYLSETNAVLLQERIFGSIDHAPAILAARAKAFGDRHAAPIEPTFIEGRDCGGAPMAGVHATAAVPARAEALQWIQDDERAIGCLLHGREAEYVFLSDVGSHSSTLQGCRGEQTTRAIERAQSILGRYDWTYNHVCRTWFYLDDILDWYDEFNQYRNDIYSSLSILNGKANAMIPASTGIRGRNLKGHACTLDLLAARGIHERCFYFERMINNKQNEATDYGSAFSRGMTINTDGGRYAFISGTASIDERGATVFADDVEAQTRRTLENIEALLDSVGGTLADIRRATVFFKYAEDAPLFERLAKEYGFAEIPVVCTVADVCRDDLLFELDATALLNWT